MCRNFLRKKILRSAQNDQEEAEPPQAFPLEGKGDRRTAVDEVENGEFIVR